MLLTNVNGSAMRLPESDPFVLTDCKPTFSSDFISMVERILTTPFYLSPDHTIIVEQEAITYFAEIYGYDKLTKDNFTTAYRGKYSSKLAFAKKHFKTHVKNNADWIFNYMSVDYNKYAKTIFSQEYGEFIFLNGHVYLNEV